MATKNTVREFSFRKPAIYKIVVQGDIDRAWSERYWGLQANRTPDPSLALNPWIRNG